MPCLPQISYSPTASRELCPYPTVYSRVSHPHPYLSSFLTPHLFFSQGSHGLTPGLDFIAFYKTPNSLAYLENTLNALPLGILPVLIVQQSMWVADELHEALSLGTTQHWVL